jgi:alpha-D-xyloside xylohydrolase
MRLHGDREPRQPQHGTTGGAICRSGAANEVWSYGKDVFKICSSYIHLREHLRQYTRDLMQEAHTLGSPIMRTLFYEFPSDPTCWRVEDEYMYGGEFLICPVFKPGLSGMNVYLPRGAKWKIFIFDGEKKEETMDGEVYTGGQDVWVECPLDRMPVFKRVR